MGTRYAGVEEVKALTGVCWAYHHLSGAEAIAHFRKALAVLAGLPEDP